MIAILFYFYAIFMIIAAGKKVVDAKNGKGRIVFDPIKGLAFALSCAFFFCFWASGTLAGTLMFGPYIGVPIVWLTSFADPLWCMFWELLVPVCYEAS
jgi:hypothetical protein